MDVKFESKDMGKAKIERELRSARKLVALVGIPSDAEQPEKGNLNLASIGLILEKGSDVNHLKARPWMQQTRIRNEKKVLNLSKKYLKAISNGTMSALEAIKKLGAAYEGAMKEIFTKGVFEKNADITVDGGWMRNHVSGKFFYVEGKKSSRPLIDTGLLSQSIKHKVAKV